MIPTIISVCCPDREARISVAPDRPDDQAADAHEDHRQEPFVKKALECPGYRLGRRDRLRRGILHRSNRLSAESPREMSGRI
jgi:hypothetical protein